MLERGRKFQAGQRAYIPFPDVSLRREGTCDLLLVGLGTVEMLNRQLLLTKGFQRGVFEILTHLLDMILILFCTESPFWIRYIFIP